MDSTEGALMITSIGLSRLRPRPVPYWSPGPERPNLSLQFLLSDIFSGTSGESFEEGYSQLTHSEILIRSTTKSTLRQKAVKLRPLFRSTSVLVEKIMHFLLSKHRNPNLINYMPNLGQIWISIVWGSKTFMQIVKYTSEKALPSH